jgi:hypothetical protein
MIFLDLSVMLSVDPVYFEGICLHITHTGREHFILICFTNVG